MSTLVADPEEYIDALRGWISEKDEPDKWHVVHGGPVGEYNITSGDMPAQLPESERSPDGVVTIGHLGWSADVFDDRVFVDEAGPQGEKIDRRLNGVLLVHEDILSDDALSRGDDDE